VQNGVGGVCSSAGSIEIPHAAERRKGLGRRSQKLVPSDSEHGETGKTIGFLQGDFRKIHQTARFHVNPSGIVYNGRGRDEKVRSYNNNNTANAHATLLRQTIFVCAPELRRIRYTFFITRDVVSGEVTTT